MTTPDFMIALFYAVDQEMLEVPKHPDATLYPSAVVPLALLCAVKGGGPGLCRRGHAPQHAGIAEEHDHTTAPAVVWVSLRRIPTARRPAWTTPGG